MRWMICLHWGENGGFYIKLIGFTKRICLWKLALTAMPEDYDEMLKQAIKKGMEDPKGAKHILEDC